MTDEEVNEQMTEEEVNEQFKGEEVNKIFMEKKLKLFREKTLLEENGVLRRKNLNEIKRDVIQAVDDKWLKKIFFLSFLDYLQFH